MDLSFPTGAKGTCLASSNLNFEIARLQGFYSLIWLWNSWYDPQRLPHRHMVVKIFYNSHPAAHMPILYKQVHIYTVTRLYKVTRNTVDTQNAPPVSKHYTEIRGHPDLSASITEICDHSQLF